MTVDQRNQLSALLDETGITVLLDELSKLHRLDADLAEVGNDADVARRINQEADAIEDLAQRIDDGDL